MFRIENRLKIARDIRFQICKLIQTHIKTCIKIIGIIYLRQVAWTNYADNPNQKFSSMPERDSREIKPMNIVQGICLHNLTGLNNDRARSSDQPFRCSPLTVTHLSGSKSRKNVSRIVAEVRQVLVGFGTWL